MSAFCDGGKFCDDGRTMFVSSLPNASTKRMGRIVKVYRKESRHTMNPNSMIYTTIKHTSPTRLVDVKCVPSAAGSISWSGRASSLVVCCG